MAYALAGGPPTASDSATINGSATDTITADTADFANSLTLSDANATLNDDGSSASLTIGGTLAVSNGTLKDGAALTVGALTLSGGALTVSGQLNVKGTLSQTGGTLTLSGGVISGGAIDSTAGTLAFTSQGGTLSGVTFDGPMNLTSGNVSQFVHLADGTKVVGSTGSGPGAINVTGEFSILYFDNTQTVDNDTINLGNSMYSDTLYQYDAVNAGNQVLTLASSVTVNVQGDALIQGSGASGDGIVNKGAIKQSGALRWDDQRRRGQRPHVSLSGRRAERGDVRRAAQPELDQRFRPIRPPRQRDESGRIVRRRAGHDQRHGRAALYFDNTQTVSNTTINPVIRAAAATSSSKTTLPTRETKC